jgi:hypothetical protein
MNYEIKFDSKVYKKIGFYVQYAQGEVSGFGKIVRDKEDPSIFHVTDVILLEQQCTGVTTELTQDSQAEFMNELITQGKGDEIGQWRLWWHSHVNMEVFWSGTDDNAIDSLDTGLEKDNFWLSTVFNKKGEVKARIDSYYPIRATVDDVDVTYISNPSKLEKKCEAEVLAKVKPKIYYNDTKIITNSKDLNERKSYQQFSEEEIWEFNYNDYTGIALMGKLDVYPTEYTNGDDKYILGKDQLYHKVLPYYTKAEKKALKKGLTALLDSYGENKETVVQKSLPSKGNYTDDYDDSDIFDKDGLINYKNWRKYYGEY